MAKSDILYSISQLSKKIDALLVEREKLLDQIQKLKAENHELSLQHQKDVMLLENTKKDVEFLRLSHKLADSPEALVEARKEISSLVRTIDSCIRLIKEN